MSTIVLTGGGTAGHVIPNLALIPFLKEHFDNIVYIGSNTGLEEQLLTPFSTVKYFPITTVKLIRSLSPRNLLIPFKLIKGKKEATQILREINPDIIFSKGGYVSLPVTFAGKKLGIPMVCHESDLSMGLANRLGCKHCCAVCTTFKETADRLDNGLYVGSPYQKREFSTEQVQRLKNQLNLNSNKPICLVAGGSQGSATLNAIVLKNVDKLLKTHQIIHLTGKGKMNNIKKLDYHALEFTQDLGLMMSIADVAITRGGSNALFEFLSYGVPMLIIPLHKGSRGDQEQNAIYFENKGYALTLLEPELNDETFQKSFANLLATAPAIRSANKFATPTDSLQKIMSTILKFRKI